MIYVLINLKEKYYSFSSGKQIGIMNNYNSRCSTKSHDNTNKDLDFWWMYMNNIKQLKEIRIQ